MPLVFPNRKSIVLNPRDPAPYIEAIGKHKHANWQGKDLYEFPYNLDTDRVLRNLGVNLEQFSPYRSHYVPPKIAGKYDPRWDQHAVAEFICLERKGWVLNPPRMGKTASAIMGLDYIRQDKQVPRGKAAALVVAPLTTLKDTWEPEIYGIRPTFSIGVLAHCSVDKRKERLAEDHDIYLINPDGVKLIQHELMQAIRSDRIAIIIVDEVTEFANTRSDRWKALAPLCWTAPWAIGMTGTPGDPTYVYGIAKLIKKDNVPATYKYWEGMTMVQVSPFKKVPSIYANAEIKKALHPAIRFEKSLLGLRQLLHVKRRADMDDKQKQVYERLRKDLMLRVANPEAGGDGTLSAVNKGVLTNKLIQIACGSVRDDEGNIIELPTDNRFAQLREEIDKSDTKVVIFTPFRATNKRLHAYLDKLYGARRVDGDITGNARQAALNDWRNKKRVKVLILHPDTGAFGLELADADTLIFYGSPLSGLITYQQAMERINSPKQTSHTPTIVQMSCSPAEDHIFRALDAGADVTKSINSLFSVIVEDAA